MVIRNTKTFSPLLLYSSEIKQYYSHECFCFVFVEYANLKSLKRREPTEEKRGMEKKKKKKTIREFSRKLMFY